MPATSGRKALVNVSGAAIAFTDEATTTLVANTTYFITNSIKRVWDRSVAIVVKKDTVVQSAALYTVNRLTGTITFLADIGGGHTITVSGSYLPLSVAAQAKEFRYDLSANNLDVSKFGDVYIPRVQGVKDVQGQLQDFKIDQYFANTLIAGLPVMLEFWLDSSTAYDLRIWALLNKAQIQSAVAGAVEETIGFAGQTDLDGRSISG